jgi:hypothetical protein
MDTEWVRWTEQKEATERGTCRWNCTAHEAFVRREFDFFAGLTAALDTRRGACGEMIFVFD